MRNLSKLLAKLESAEERQQRIEREYILDEETGDILARKPTPYELALLEGRDWYREAENEPPLDPDDMLYR